MGRKIRCCSVAGCLDKTSTRHYFPSDKRVRDTWLQRVGNKKLLGRGTDFLTCYAVCDIHFAEMCKDAGGKLLRYSLPTLHLPEYNEAPSRANCFIIPEYKYRTAATDLPNVKLLPSICTPSNSRMPETIGIVCSSSPEVVNCYTKRKHVTDKHSDAEDTSSEVNKETHFDTVYIKKEIRYDADSDEDRLGYKIKTESAIFNEISSVSNEALKAHTTEDANFSTKTFCDIKKENIVNVENVYEAGGIKLEHKIKLEDIPSCNEDDEISNFICNDGLEGNFVAESLYDIPNKDEDDIKKIDPSEQARLDH